MTTTAVMGLKPGMAAKMKRPSTESAVMTDTRISRRVPVLRRSKPQRNTISAMTVTNSVLSA